LRYPFRWVRTLIHYLIYPDKLLAPLIDIFAENPIRWGTRILGASILGGGLLFSLIEQKASYPDGMWWAYISAMTVGYGDYSPATWLMRALAVGVVFGGALFLIGLGSAVNARATVKRLAKVSETPELHDDIGAVVQGLRDQADVLETIGNDLMAREMRQEGTSK
jgi:hypothetical protein